MRIGSRRVILQTTILIPDGEDATIPLQHGTDWNLEIRIVVHPEGKQTIEWKAEGDGKLLIEFRGMPAILGSTSGAAHQLFKAGPNDSQRVFFSSSYFRVGTLSTVHLQFLMEQD